MLPDTKLTVNREMYTWQNTVLAAIVSQKINRLSVGQLEIDVFEAQVGSLTLNANFDKTAGGFAHGQPERESLPELARAPRSM
jgi:hypothetical protein